MRFRKAARTACRYRGSLLLDELEWYARALKAARARDQERERSNCSAQRLIAAQP
ncbi:MAG: hypothetical protein H0U97_05135 [Gammaproteobacteria bacterium]|nr:hypothetical protein [Gammaproteobacteria bacterium]